MARTPATVAAARVFLSYSHAESDRAAAEAVAAYLQPRFPVFWDRKLIPGDDWGERIQRALEASDVLIVIVSPSSIESAMVRGEVEIAHQRRLPIIPIRLNYDGPLRYPLNAYLNRYQWLVWQDGAEPLLSRLGEAIEQAIQHKPSVPSVTTASSNRQRMIERVRHDWVEGMLDRSLYRTARIELQLDHRDEAVERPLNLVVQRPLDAPRPLPRGTPISIVFDDHLGQLLILGQPGGGKTTLLLELAEELLRRAGDDPNHPIPVVFNLAPWGQTQSELGQWMAEELNHRYDVPKATARGWLQQEVILPLLDGLDEVAPELRAQCVDAINAYRTDHGWVRMAVCSRIAEYEELTSKLRLPAAVVVQPLEPSDVTAYLLTAGGELAALHRSVQQDPALLELLSTPLMLTVAALAFSGARSMAPPEPMTRQKLFDRYVQAMFRWRAPVRTFSEQDTIRWLGGLASKMSRRGQRMFHLEDLNLLWVDERPELGSAILALLASLLVASVGGLFSLINKTVVPSSDTDSDSALTYMAGILGLSMVAWLVVGWAPRHGKGAMATPAWLMMGSIGLLAPLVALQWMPVITNDWVATSVLVGSVALLKWAASRWNGAWEPTFLAWNLGTVAGVQTWLTAPRMLGLPAVWIGVAAAGLAAGLVSLIVTRRGSKPVQRALAMCAFVATILFADALSTTDFLFEDVVRGVAFLLLGTVGAIFSTFLFGRTDGGAGNQPVERLRWSPKAGVRGAIAGLIVGSMANLLASLFFIDERLTSKSAIGILGWGIAGFVMLGLGGGLVQGVVEARGGAGEGLRRSVRYALFAALALGLGTVPAMIAASGDPPKNIKDLMEILYGAALVAVIMFLGRGGMFVMEHYLTRWMLRRRGELPKNLEAFLEFAAERLLLRKVGGGYVFVHGLLMDHLASRSKPE